MGVDGRGADWVEWREGYFVWLVCFFGYEGGGGREVSEEMEMEMGEMGLEGRWGWREMEEEMGLEADGDGDGKWW